MTASLLTPSPIYEADGVSVFHGDSLVLMHDLVEPVDAVLADLPYGTTRNTWDRVLPNKLLWHAWHAVARPNAAIVAFGTGSFTARLIVDALADYRYSLVWDKDAVTGFLNAKRQPMRSHEDLAVFYRRQPTYNPQMVYTGRSSHSRGKKAERKINHWGGFENTEVVDQEA